MISVQPQASHYIDGAYVEDAGGTDLDVVYPATGEVIAELHQATPALIGRALDSAERAQREWALRKPVERGRILRKAAEIIRERNAELARLETLDTGKPLQETLVADPASGADAFEYFGGLAATITGEYIPLGGENFAYSVRVPLGVCLGIGAWNYPSQIACWKAAPALACGNAMIFKPSEVTPLTALKIAEILTEAGLPDGLFNVLQGEGSVAAALLESPVIAKVSLTGSAPTGKKVYAAAAARMKHATMELGGKSPLIIFGDADLDNAVSGAILANYYSSGQVCSNGTRVFVERSVHRAFVERLIARLEKVTIGDPLDERTSFGPLVSARQRQIVLDLIARGKAEGATLAYGGEAIEGSGFYMTPALFTDVTDDMTIAREEIFGPVMAVLEFDNEDDVVSRANDTELGLAGGVFTRDLNKAHRVVAGLEAGTCYINCYNNAPVETAFGGVKGSGIGRENSKAAIGHYTELKTVHVQIDPVEAPF